MLNEQLLSPRFARLIERLAEIRCIRCFRGSHQADPPSARTRSFQGRQVPYPDLAQRGPEQQGRRGQEHHQVPAQEGLVSRCCRRPHRYDRGPDRCQRHVVNQLLGLSAQEELAKRCFAARQERERNAPAI